MRFRERHKTNIKATYACRRLEDLVLIICLLCWYSCFFGYLSVVVSRQFQTRSLSCVCLCVCVGNVFWWQGWSFLKRVWSYFFTLIFLSSIHFVLYIQNYILLSINKCETHLFTMYSKYMYWRHVYITNICCFRYDSFNTLFWHFFLS